MRNSENYKLQQEKDTRRRIHIALEKEFGSCIVLDTLEDEGGWFQIEVQVPYNEYWETDNKTTIKS